MTQRACRSCKKWHDLDQPWPAACYSHFGARPAASGQIIKDIDPYKTVAADISGKRIRVGSRREHREFLKRNELMEVGNDMPKSAPQREIRGDFSGIGRDVKTAIEQLRGQGRIK